MNCDITRPGIPRNISRSALSKMLINSVPLDTKIVENNEIGYAHKVYYEKENKTAIFSTLAYINNGNHNFSIYISQIRLVFVATDNESALACFFSITCMSSPKGNKYHLNQVLKKATMPDVISKSKNC